MLFVVLKWTYNPLEKNHAGFIMKCRLKDPSLTSRITASWLHSSFWWHVQQTVQIFLEGEKPQIKDISINILGGCCCQLWTTVAWIGNHVVVVWKDSSLAYPNLVTLDRKRSRKFHLWTQVMQLKFRIYTSTGVL